MSATHSMCMCPDCALRVAVGRAKRDGACTYCGQAVTETPGRGNTRTRDHVVARSKGGRVTATACRDCNTDKGSGSLPQWLASLILKRVRNTNPNPRLDRVLANIPDFYATGLLDIGKLINALLDIMKQRQIELDRIEDAVNNLRTLMLDRRGR